jgi:hypothetical protein
VASAADVLHHHIKTAPATRWLSGDTVANILAAGRDPFYAQHDAIQIASAIMPA